MNLIISRQLILVGIQMMLYILKIWAIRLKQCAYLSVADAVGIRTHKKLRCTDLKCEHFCISDKDRHPECACHKGYILQGDRRSCNGNFSYNYCLFRYWVKILRTALAAWLNGVIVFSLCNSYDFIIHTIVLFLRFYDSYDFMVFMILTILWFIRFCGF